MSEFNSILERYCNELELKNINLTKEITLIKEANDEYQQSQHDLYMELKKYQKALDKACEQLAGIEEIVTLDNSYHDKELWKEWCLKDEQV